MDAQPPRMTGAAPRVQLTVLRGPGEGSKLRLTRCLSLFGSRPGCKVVLRHEAVAPVHCAIVNTGSDVFLRDFMTPSGTFLNDLRAECERLEDGYVLRVSPWEFQIEMADPLADTRSDAALMDLEPTRTVALQVVGNGQLIKLQREVAVIGRRPGCDVVLQHRRVSRAHAIITGHLGQPTVFDLLSENRIRVNEQEVAFAPLQSGDVLEIGPVSLRAVIPESVRPAPLPDSRAGTGTSTATAVIELEEDIDDKIDIRAAEGSPRDAV